MDAAVASPVPPVGIPSAGGTPTAVPHPAMATGGVAALPPPRGSAVNVGGDAPTAGLASPPINAVEATPGTGAAIVITGPSAKHRVDGPLSSVNSLVNDLGSFSMGSAVALGQPRSSPQPAAASLPPASSGALAAASGGELAEVGMTAACPAVAVTPMTPAAGTAASAGTAAAGTTVVAGTASAVGTASALDTAGAPTLAVWAGSVATPAVGNTHPVVATDRGKLGGLGPSHAGVPSGAVGVPNRVAGLPNEVGTGSDGRVASGQASAADVHAYGVSAQPRETMVEMWVPLAAVGSVIGSHGTVIKSLQSKSGATIVVHNEVFDATASSKMITINGPRESVATAKTLVDEVVARPRGGGGGGGGGCGGGGRGGSFSQSLSVPAEALTASDRLRQIASQTGAKLVVTGPAARSVGSGAGGPVAAAAGAPTGGAAADARGTTAAWGSDRPAAPALVHVQITGRQHAVRNAASMLVDGHNRHSNGGPGACVVSAGGVSPPRGGGGGGGEGVTDRSPSGPPRRASNAAADGATASGGGGLSTSSGGGAPVRETIGVRNDKVGLLIGRGGVHVQNIQDRSGASVQVHKDTNAPMNSGSGVGSAGAGGVPPTAAGGRAVTPSGSAVAMDGGAPTAASNAATAAARGAPAVATTGVVPPALPPPMLRAVTITGTRGAVDLAKNLISDRVGGIHPPPPGTAVPAAHPHHYHGPHHHGHHGHHHPHGGYHGVLPPLAAVPPHMGPAAFQHHVAVAAAASATAGGGTSPPRGMPPGVGAGALGANGVGSPPPAVPGPGPGGALGPAVGRLSVSPLLVAQQAYPYAYAPYVYPGVPPAHVQPPPVYRPSPYDGVMYPVSPGGTGASPAAAVSPNGVDMRAYYMAHLYGRQQQAPRQGGVPVAGTAMYGYGVLPAAPPVAVSISQPVSEGGRQVVEDGPVA